MPGHLPAAEDVPQEVRNLANYVVFTFLKMYHENVESGKFEPFEYADGEKVSAYEMAKVLVSAAQGTLAPNHKKMLDDMQQNGMLAEIFANMTQGYFNSIGVPIAAVSAAYAAGSGSMTPLVYGLMIAAVPMALGVLLSNAPKYIDKKALSELVESHFSRKLTPIDLERLQAFKAAGVQQGTPDAIVVGAKVRVKHIVKRLGFLTLLMRESNAKNERSTRTQFQRTTPPSRPKCESSPPHEYLCKWAF